MPRYRTVVFDCDSTLSAVEGIDELSRGHRDEVVRLTEAAMAGTLRLEEVYEARLALARPTRDAVAALAATYIARLVPDARETVAALTRAGVTVRVISGGLRPAVVALAAAIDIAEDDVAAVDVYFDDHGEYRGFDTSSPLARADGKRDVLGMWGNALPRPIMFVGDGATDLAAKPVVDAFVAFAGVVARADVMAQADAVVTANSVAPVLVLALGDDPPRDADDRALYELGARLLGRASPLSPRAAGRAAAPNSASP